MVLGGPKIEAVAEYKAYMYYGVGHLPRKTELKLYFELGVNGLSVVRYFYRLL